MDHFSHGHANADFHVPLAHPNADLLLRLDALSHTTTLDLDACTADSLLSMVQLSSLSHADADSGWRMRLVLAMSTPYSLRSFAGGLNTRDLPSALGPTELQALENFHIDNNDALTQRGGEQMLQYAPVNPTPFTADANTLGLWTFDAYPFVDSAHHIGNLSGQGTGTAPSVTAGLFDNAANLALPSASNLGNYCAPSPPPSGILNGLSALTIEFWTLLNVGPQNGTFPVTAAGQTANFPVSVGAPAFGTYMNTNGVLSLLNGITYQYGLNPDNNEVQAYLQAQVTTALPQGSQATIVKTKYLPSNSWIHVRMTYNATTGVLCLYINGNLEATAIVTVAANVYDAGSQVLVGGIVYSFGGSEPCSVWPGLLDEMMVSNVVRTTFPFFQMRGKGFEYWNSSGVHQFLIQAETGLFYGDGTGGWNLMENAVNNNGVFNFNSLDPNYWDMVQLGDYMYLSDGLNVPQCWDGQTLVDWGDPSTPPNLSLLNGLTGPAAGVTAMAYTYVYGNLETGLSPVAQIDNPSGFQVLVSGIPWRHANCSAVRFYVQKQNSATWYLWRQLNNTSGQFQQISGPYNAGSPPSYSGDGGAYGVPDSSLGDTGFPAIEANPGSAITYNWRYLLVQGRRLLVCGHSNEPYGLRYSELDTPDVFNAFNLVEANSGLGPLNGMAQYYGDTVVSKDGNSMLVLRGTDPATWTNFELLHPTIGCIDHWGFVHHFPTIPPGDAAVDTASSDRYVLLFPGTDGFYAYEGQDIRKISDKINPTYGQISQLTADLAEWILDSEADFETNLSQGGSATANVQDNNYESDGIRQKPGQLGPFNQLNYLGLWSATNPLVPGRVLALCPAGADGAFYFSTDYDGTLYLTQDNFNTIAGKWLNAAFSPQERIIEIVGRPGGNQAVASLLLLTDTQNLASIATIPNAVAAAPTKQTQIAVSTSNAFVALNTPGNVQTQLVDVYAPITLNTGIQAPIIAGLEVVGVPAQGQILVANVPVAIPANSFIMDPGAGAFSGGGYAYFFTTGSNTFQRVSATALYYDNDVPFVRASQLTTQPQSATDGTQFFSGLTGIGQGSQQYQPSGQPTASSAWPDSAYNLFLNHRQTVQLAYSLKTFSGPPAGTPITYPLWYQLVPKVDSQTNFDWPIYGPGQNGSADSTLTIDGGTLVAFSGVLGALPPGFWCLFSYANYDDGSANTTGFQFWANATLRKGPQWLGGTFRPQAFYDAVNGNFVFLSSGAEDANGNRSVSLCALSAPAGVLSQYNSMQPSGWNLTKNCLSALGTDGANAFYSVYQPPQVVNTGSGGIIQYTKKGEEEGTLFALNAAALTDLPVTGTTNDNLTFNDVPLRFAYAPSTGRILWSGLNFNQAQAYPETPYGNFYGFAGDLNGTAEASATPNITLASTTYNTAEPLDTAYFCELCLQTDTPGVFVAACNQPDGVTAAFSLVQPDVSIPEGGATSDVSTLQGEPYTGSGVSTGPGTGVLSNLVFSQASGAANSYLWADRIYFSTTTVAATDSRLVQLGFPGDWTVKGQYIGPWINLGTFQAFSSVDTDENGTFALYLRNSTSVAGLPTNEAQVTPNGPLSSVLFDPPNPFTQWRMLWTWTYSTTTPTAAPYCTYVSVNYYAGANPIALPRISGASYQGRSYWTVAAGGDSNNLVLVYEKTRTWMTITPWTLAGISIWRGMLTGIEVYGWVQLEAGNDDLGSLIVGKAQTGTLLGPVYIGANEQPAFAQIAHFLGQVDKLVSAMQANVQSFVNQVVANQSAWLIITPYAGETPKPTSAWALPVPADTQVETLRVRARPYGRFGYDWARAFSLLIATSQDASGPYVQLVGVPVTVHAIDLELDLTEPTYDIPVR